MWLRSQVAEELKTVTYYVGTQKKEEKRQKYVCIRVCAGIKIVAHAKSHLALGEPPRFFKWWNENKQTNKQTNRPIMNKKMCCLNDSNITTQYDSK